MKISYPIYKQLSTDILIENRKLKEEYLAYIECLNELTKVGVVSGPLHDELVIYTTYVTDVPTLIDSISNKTKALINSYLTDMNKAQKYEGEYIIYEENYLGTRDYTKENFQLMQRDCDETGDDANVFGKVADFFEDLADKIVLFFGKLLRCWDARQTRSLIMEINDITKKQLTDIRNNLCSTEDYYYTNAQNLYNCVVKLNEYIQTLDKVTASDIGTFSMAPFTLKLDELHEGITETLDGIYVDPGLSWKAVEKFIKTDDVEAFFSKHTVEIKNFIADLSSMDMKDIDFWKMTISQMFDVAIKEMMGWARKLFGDDYDYETYLYDNEMMKIFDQLSKSKTYDDSVCREHVEAYEEFMGLIKKYGDKWEEHLTGMRDENGKLILDKRTKHYKQFKAFFEQFGSAEKILKYGTDGIEVLAAFTADYEKNLEILNTLIDDCDPNSEMAQSLARIKLRYESSWENGAAIVKEKFIQYGNSHITKNILKNKKFETELFKAANVFKVVGWVELAIDVVNETTGLGEESKAKIELLTYGYDQLDSAESAYQNALSKIKLCDPDSENYESCLNEFTTSFEYYRTILKRLYTKMASASSGTQRSYYRYCAQMFENLNLENYEYFDLQTYEEYIAL